MKLLNIAAFWKPIRVGSFLPAQAKTATWAFLILFLAPFWLVPLRAATPSVTGQWDFEQGDLRATVGSDLEYVGDTAGITSFPVVNVSGQSASVMAFSANSVSQGFYMRHGAKPNGGGLFVNQYTLIMDVMYPAASSDLWRALFSTDPFNAPGGDTLFVGDNSTLPTANGLGADGEFQGAIQSDTWYRIAFVVDLTKSSGQLSKYINGTLVAAQTLVTGVDGPFSLGPSALLFTAPAGSGALTQPGLVGSVQFFNGALPNYALAALGGPNAGGISPANSSLTITSIKQSPSAVTLTWSGGPGPFQVQAATARTGGVSWHNVGSPTSYHSLTLPRVYAVSLYRIQQFRGTPPTIVPTPFATVDNLLPTTQMLRPAGKSLSFNGRPVDVLLSRDGKKAYLKNINSLIVVDTVNWRVLQTLRYPFSGASMHGITLSPDGSHLYVTGSQNEIYDYSVGTTGLATFSRTITLAGTPDPCGISVSPDGKTAFVCLGLFNSLGIVDLTNGKLTSQINVGVAPWDVKLSADGRTAYVSDWGGRKPVTGDLTALSAGTLVVVDERGVGASGAVSFVDLVAHSEIGEVPTGLHPCDLALSADGNTLYVANANSDSVTVINTVDQSVQETILVRPDPALPAGSDPDAVTLSRDGTQLYVAAAGNNAMAVFELPNTDHTNSVLKGLLPTDWYPGAIACDSNYVYVVNVKGIGTVPSNLANSQGSLDRLPLPTATALNKHTVTVRENGRVREILATQAPAQTNAQPVPVPVHVGEPSVFQHVVYIIKENRCYDGVLGDLPQGNGSSNLCLFPQAVTPNHHALASQYVLLDNYYCNGVISADGHSWAVEGHVTDHIEKSFGGFSRSYALGTDALTYSSSGFIWDNVLSHGLTYRNYGELNLSGAVPGGSWLHTYRLFTNSPTSLTFRHQFGIASMIPNTSTNVPGWNQSIPDVVRADGFIRDLRTAESNGVWAALHVLYLPNDHTMGLTPGYPSPRANMADNDLAVGQVVEAITSSSFGSNTVIFVTEDDPQAGPDHVDGRRSLCLVISPYTRRAQTVSTFFTQAGVVHTMEQILGVPPMNQMDAMAPLMFDCFTNTPDFTPYTALANNIPLDEMNPGTLGMIQRGSEEMWANRSLQLDFSKPDLINEDDLNRIIWHAVKGDARYPMEYAGAHGKGLKRLGLIGLKPVKDLDD